MQQRADFFTLPSNLSHPFAGQCGLTTRRAPRKSTRRRATWSVFCGQHYANLGNRTSSGTDVDTCWLAEELQHLDAGANCGRRTCEAGTYTHRGSETNILGAGKLCITAHSNFWMSNASCTAVEMSSPGPERETSWGKVHMRWFEGLEVAQKIAPVDNAVSRALEAVAAFDVGTV